MREFMYIRRRIRPSITVSPMSSLARPSGSAGVNSDALAKRSVAMIVMVALLTGVAKQDIGARSLTLNLNRLRGQMTLKCTHGPVSLD